MAHFDMAMELALVKYIKHKLIDEGLETPEIDRIVTAVLDSGYEYDEDECASYTVIGDDGERYTVIPVECTLTVCVELPRNKCLICEMDGDASIACGECELWSTTLKNFYYGENEEN